MSMQAFACFGTGVSPGMAGCALSRATERKEGKRGDGRWEEGWGDEGERRKRWEKKKKMGE